MRHDEDPGRFDVLPAAGDVDRVVDGMVSNALDRTDELADGLFELARLNVRSYGRGRSRLETQDLRLSIARLATIILACVGEAKAPSAQDRVALTMIGAQRAREGVAKEEVLRVAQLCLQGVRTFLLGTVHHNRKVSVETALAAAAAIADRLDECSASIEAAFEAGYTGVDDEILKNGGIRNEARFANLILGGRWRTEAGLRGQLMELGKPLGKTHGVVVLVPSDKPEDIPLAEAARRVSQSIRGTALLEATFWSPRPHVPIVVSLATIDSPAAWRERFVASLDAGAVRHELIAVVSEPVDELEQLQHAYVAIRRDLGYLPVALSDAGAVSAQRLDLFATMAGDGRDLGRLTQIVSRVFRRIEEQPNAGELLTLFRAYYRSNGMWERVWEELDLHRNTGRQRVQKIEDLTGLSFRDVADCHELMTVYRLRELLRAQFDLLDGHDAP
jgi:hypothetical protein